MLTRPLTIEICLNIFQHTDAFWRLNIVAKGESAQSVASDVLHVGKGYGFYRGTQFILSQLQTNSNEIYSGFYDLLNWTL